MSETEPFSIIERVGTMRRFTSEQHAIRFEAESILEKWDVSHAVIKIYSDEPGHAGLITEDRVSLIEGDRRKAFAQRLFERLRRPAIGRVLDLVICQDLVEEACYELRKETRRAARPVALTGEFSDGDDEQETFLYQPLLLASAVPTALFGAGGSGKTWVALAIAASVASGRSYIDGLGAPTKAAPVLWLDYENDERILRNRSARITGGVATPNLFYLRGAGALADQVDSIAALVAEFGIGLIVVDTITGAAGGDLNENSTATRLMNALRTLGVPILIVAHTAKGSGNGIFGAVAFRDQCRLVWSVEHSEESAYVLLKDTKRNSAAKSPDIGLGISFDDGGTRGAVRLALADVGELPEDLARGLRCRDQVLNALRGEALTLEELVEAVDAKRDTLSRMLRRMSGERLIVRWEDGKYALPESPKAGGGRRATPLVPPCPPASGAVVQVVLDLGKEAGGGRTSGQPPASEVPA